LELQFQKAFRRTAFTLNYTFLDHWNESDDQPLTALSKHNLNFDFQLYPGEKLRIGLLGLLASSSYWLDFNTNEMLDIPSYFNLDEGNLLFYILIIFASAKIFGTLCIWVKIPAIVGELMAGILLGNYVLGIIDTPTMY